MAAPYTHDELAEWSWDSMHREKILKGVGKEVALVDTERLVETLKNEDKSEDVLRVMFGAAVHCGDRKRQAFFEELVESSGREVIMNTFYKGTPSVKNLVKKIFSLGVTSSVVFLTHSEEKGLLGVLGLPQPATDVILRVPEELPDLLDSFLTSESAVDAKRMLLVIQKKISHDGGWKQGQDTSKIKAILDSLKTVQEAVYSTTVACLMLMPQETVLNLFLSETTLPEALTRRLCRFITPQAANATFQLATFVCGISVKAHTAWVEDCSLVHVGLEVKRTRFQTTNLFNPLKYLRHLAGSLKWIMDTLTFVTDPDRLLSLLTDMQCSIKLNSSDVVESIILKDGLAMLRKLFVKHAILRYPVVEVVCELVTRTRPADHGFLAKEMFKTKIFNDCFSFISPKILKSLPDAHNLEEMMRKCVTIVQFVTKGSPDAADEVVQPLKVESLLEAHQVFPFCGELSSMLTNLSPLLPEEATVEELLLSLDQITADTQFSSVAVRVKGIPNWSQEFLPACGISLCLELLMAKPSLTLPSLLLINDCLSELSDDLVARQESALEIYNSTVLPFIIASWRESKKKSPVAVLACDLVEFCLLNDPTRDKRILKSMESELPMMVYGMYKDPDEKRELKALLDPTVEQIMEINLTEWNWPQAAAVFKKNHDKETFVNAAMEHNLWGKVTDFIVRNEHTVSEQWVCLDLIPCGDILAATPPDKCRKISERAFEQTHSSSARLVLKIMKQLPEEEFVPICDSAEGSHLLCTALEVFIYGTHGVADPVWRELLAVLIGGSEEIENVMWSVGSLPVLNAFLTLENDPEANGEHTKQLYLIAAAHCESSTEKRDAVDSLGLLDRGLKSTASLESLTLITSLRSPKIHSVWNRRIEEHNVLTTLSRLFTIGSSLPDTVKYVTICYRLADAVVKPELFLPIVEVMDEILSVIESAKYRYSYLVISGIVDTVSTLPKDIVGTNPILEHFKFFIKTKPPQIPIRIISTMVNILSGTGFEIPPSVESLPSQDEEESIIDSPKSLEVPIIPKDWKGMSEVEYLTQTKTFKLYDLMTRRLLERRPTCDRNTVPLVKELLVMLEELEEEQGY